MTWFLAGVLFTLLMEAGFLGAVGLDRLEARLNKTGPAEEPRTLGIGETSGRTGVTSCATGDDVSSRVGGASIFGRLDAAEPRGATSFAAPGGSRGPGSGETPRPSAASSRPYDREAESA